MNFPAPSVHAQAVVTTTIENEPKENNKLSLIELSPDLLYALRRYPKFYDDDNTIHGDILARSYLLDDLGGVRDKLVEHGFYFDASVTQFFGYNMGGKEASDYPRVNGSADYYLTVDTAQAGLWPGGMVIVHGETSWNADRSINKDVGSLLPSNFDAIFPTINDSRTTLSEAYLAQGLPGNLLFIGGKGNFAGLADQNYFANNERTQFSYTGLCNNPIIGAFVPYTPLGAGLLWAPNKKHTIAGMVLDKEGDVRKSGFNTAFDWNTTSFAGQYQYSPIIRGDLPGNYRVIGAYTTQDLQSFDIDRRQLIGQILGVVPAATKDDNYGIMLNFDQYLWVKGGSLKEYQDQVDASGIPGMARHKLQPVGFGIFSRAGWAPSDRNVIDEFYSFGIGGTGMIIPGHDNDQWGIGWAITHLSHDFRGAAKLIGSDPDTYENGGEIFYNFELTPALHLTLNAQIIESPANGRDTAFVLGSRVQVDF
jgi:carbohydrate-selective porin OprB